MKFYETLQHTIASDAHLHLPECRSDSIPDLLVRKRKRQESWPDKVEYYNRDTSWGRFGCAPGGWHVIEYPGYVSFLACPGFREILYDAAPNCSDDTLDHLILDQAIPMVLSGRGLSVLHCSAIHFPQGIVAFLGPSGYGKSTLAASFAREGFPLASDDCLLVRGDTTGYLGVPAYPGVRLWPPSMEALFSGDTSMSGVAQFTQKRRVSDRESLPFSPSPACLRGLYVLDPSPDEDTRIEALTGAAAVGKLLESCFILTDRIAGAMRAIFSTLGGMVSAGLTFRLVYPSSFGRMPEVRKQILQHAVPLRSQPGRASVLCV